MYTDCAIDAHPEVRFTVISEGDAALEEAAQERIAALLPGFAERAMEHPLYARARTAQAPEWAVAVGILERGVSSPFRVSFLNSMLKGERPSLAPHPRLDDPDPDAEPVMYQFRRYISKYFAFLFEEETGILHVRAAPTFWTDPTWPEVELPTVLAEVGADLPSDDTARRAGRFAIACALAHDHDLKNMTQRKAVLESSILFLEVQLGTRVVLTPEHFRHRAAAAKCMLARLDVVRANAAKFPAAVLELEERDAAAAQQHVLHWQRVEDLIVQAVSAQLKPALFAVIRFQLSHAPGAWMTAIEF
jgi:hypothetical protein